MFYLATTPQAKNRANQNFADSLSSAARETTRWNTITAQKLSISSTLQLSVSKRTTMMSLSIASWRFAEKLMTSHGVPKAVNHQRGDDGHQLKKKTLVPTCMLDQWNLSARQMRKVGMKSFARSRRSVSEYESKGGRKNNGVREISETVKRKYLYQPFPWQLQPSHPLAVISRAFSLWVVSII